MEKKELNFMVIVTDNRKNALDMRKGHLSHPITTQEIKKKRLMEFVGSKNTPDLWAFDICYIFFHNIINYVDNKIIAIWQFKRNDLFLRITCSNSSSPD